MDKIGKKGVNLTRKTRIRLTGKHPAAILLIVFCLLSAWSAPAWATSASISASESNGPVSVSASASFTAYENCDNATPPNCTTNSSGSLAIYLNGAHVKTVGGNGSASWSYEYNAAYWANGTYTFRAVASDSKYNTGVSESSVTIDNTPTASVSSPGQPSGPIDPTGNASFKNSITGYDGIVGLEIDRSPNFASGSPSYVTCDGGCSVSYSDIPYHYGLLETALLKSGDHSLHIRARSVSGLDAADSTPFTVDNIPKISSGVSGELSGPEDVSATVGVNEYSKGWDAIVGMSVDAAPVFSGTSTYKLCDEGGSCTVKYSDITGHAGPLETATLKTGNHSVVVLARNRANEDESKSFPFTVDNIPKINSGVSGELSGPVDVSATIGLNEYSKGWDAIVGMSVDAAPVFNGTSTYKLCDEGGSCTVKYSDITGHAGPLETATLKTGNHSLVVLARNRANEDESKSFPFSVDNIPKITSGISGELSGPVDFSVTVKANDYSKGWDAIVGMSVDASPVFSGPSTYKLCDGGGCTVKYSDITGHPNPVETAILKNGNHSLVALARNRANEDASASFPFTVDNTPFPQVNSPGYVSGPFSITGMVSFKEYSKGAEGTVYVAIDSPTMAGNKSKTLEGASASYTFTGYNAATMTKGKHTVYARALSVNGTWSEIVHADFEVGEPDPLRENVQNKTKDAAQTPAN